MGIYVLALGMEDVDSKTEGEAVRCVRGRAGLGWAGLGISVGRRLVRRSVWFAGWSVGAIQPPAPYSYTSSAVQLHVAHALDSLRPLDLRFSRHTLRTHYLSHSPSAAAACTETQSIAMMLGREPVPYVPRSCLIERAYLSNAHRSTAYHT